MTEEFKTLSNHKIDTVDIPYGDEEWLRVSKVKKFVDRLKEGVRMQYKYCGKQDIDILYKYIMRRIDELEGPL